MSVEKPVGTNVLVRGGPGSGKTIMVVEGAKVKISKLVDQNNKNIKVFVSSHHSSDEPLLRQKLTKELMKLDLDSQSHGIEVESLDLQSFCKRKNISTKNPIEKINRITNKLCEDDPDKMIILIVDEMEPVEEITIRETQCYQRGSCKFISRSSYLLNG